MAQLKGGSYVGGDLIVANDLYANLYKSYVATGTAPLVVNSTTLVTNLNANYVNGFVALQSNTGNAIVVRDANGYITTSYINSSRGDEASAAASYIYDIGDGYMRKKTLANTKTEIVTSAAVISGLGFTPYNSTNPNGYTTNTGTVTSVGAGNGMNFTSITGTGSVVLGTPSSCSPATSNATSTNSHTHTITGVLVNIVEDTTPDLGGVLTLNQYNIDFSATLSTNNSYSGYYEIGTVGENVVFGDVLYLKFSDGKWWKAKADAYITTPATRMAMASISANATGVLLIEGNVRYDSWAFGTNKVYLSAATAGAITTTQPSTTGNQIQVIGIAKSTTKLYFRPSYDIGEK